ncbi:MAG: GTP-binding protein [Candidatus Heimdallarchaeum aukensis]|uniref:GTP-binding protein n=1 Tax=Candidatus Heimdallarchaeum aukensis TaxID=2876573 RepID=A0A9Y1BK74_9ARCH|nr:MAG: GTP-binding protein [Candidatus Heimdallarchaeum aukensis]
MIERHLYKIITIGSAFVGKTSLARRYAMNTFSYSYIPTMGVSWLTKSLSLTKDELNENLSKNILTDDVNVRISLWDTGAQEIFGFVRQKYFLGAKVAIVVYDITKTSTFDDVSFWVSEIKKKCSEIPIILCGNKSDLKNARAVDREKAEEYAKENNFDYIETSALSSENVEKLFSHAARLAIQSEEKVLKFREIYIR